MLSTVLRTLYGSLWKAAIPLLKRHKRLKAGFEERLVPDTWPAKDFSSIQKSISPSPTIWFQAASGGEATLLFPLIEAFCKEFKKNSPDSSLPLFLCTTCTEQGMDIISKQTSLLPPPIQERIKANYLPLDAPAIMRKAIQQVRPSLVVLLETELWPGLLHELTRTRVPYTIVNARMTEKTSRSYQKAKRFFNQHQPRAIVATTPENARRFELVFHTQPTVAPNIKFDVIEKQLLLENSPKTSAEYERVTSLLSLSESQVSPQSPARATAASAIVPPLIALASVRQEEEEHLGPIVEMICRHSIRHVPCICLLAPRHLHRIPFWMQWLEKTGIPFVLKSELDTPFHKNTRCILWDTFGEFNLLYALADTAFVGGSLAPLGGQNFLEPLGQGTPTVIGPSWSNFAWVGQDLFTEGLAREQNTAEDVGKTLLEMTSTLLAASPSQWSYARMAQKEVIRAKLREVINHNTGGSQKTAALLYSLLTTVSPSGAPHEQGE